MPALPCVQHGSTLRVSWLDRRACSMALPSPRECTTDCTIAFTYGVCPVCVGCTIARPYPRATPCPVVCTIPLKHCASRVLSNRARNKAPPSSLLSMARTSTRLSTVALDRTMPPMVMAPCCGRGRAGLLDPVAAARWAVPLWGLCRGDGCPIVASPWGALSWSHHGPVCVCACGPA